MTFCLYSIKFIPGHINFSMCHVNTLFATYAIYLISNWLLVEIKGKYYHTHTLSHAQYTHKLVEVKILCEINSAPKLIPFTIFRD